MILAIVFLASSLLLALCSARKFDSQNHLAYALPLSIAFSSFALFLSSTFLGFGQASILVSVALMLACCIPFRKEIKPGLLQKNLVAIAVLSLLFFVWTNHLMFHYDSLGGVEGFPTDFGFHKSIIASIANGNFPPQHPLLSGQPLSYYYFQHLYSAGLVAGGMDLPTASAIPNTFANAAVVLLLFILAGRIMPGKAKGLARYFPHAVVILVLLNGNLSFFNFIQKNGLNFDAITQFSEFTDLKLTAYPVLNLLSAHLLVTTYAVGLAILLIAAIKILDKEFGKTIVIGLLPLLSLPAFIAGILMLAFYTLQEEKARKPFAIALAISLPQLAFYALTHGAPAAYLKLGWLSPAQDPVSIAIFWLQNLGLYAILGIAGYTIAKNDVKKLLQSTLAPFIAGNIFIFTPFAWDTGKLFLFFFAMLAVLSATALARVAEKHRFLALALLASMILTGLFSIATVIANSSTSIYDSFDMQACKWVEQNTPPNALFLTDGQHTCVFAIAGRKVFLGDVEWMETHGLDYAKQLQENNAMLAGDCKLIRNKGVGYVYLDGYGGRHAPVNETFLRNNAVIAFQQNNRVVYKVNC
ncbi:MAG: hypothetical protein QXR53_04685 [Candidatus Norongarragalinales archaeon]